MTVMILPLRLISKVRLPQNTKLSLLALFLLGFVVIAASILTCVEGSKRDFLSGANFSLYCNISITAAAGIACLPQIRMLFLKRFRKSSQRDRTPQVGETMSHDRSMATPGSGEDSTMGTTSSEKRGKSTPLILTHKFLSGDGKMGVGSARLSEKRGNEDEPIIGTK